jgi:hypothetical protein
MFVDPEERTLLVDMIAQAVIDRLEERDKVNKIADMIVARVIALQKEEQVLREEEARVLADAVDNEE